MDRLRYLVIGFLALFLAGCGSGQIVVETLNVADGPAANAPGTGKSIVILPFADYADGNIASVQQRNMLVTEALTDRLLVNGFSLPIQEDVLDYLVKENIIGTTKNSSIATELTDDDWSKKMQTELNFYMNQVENNSAGGEGNSAGTHGLDTKTVAKIGQQFNADYIIRGRIIDFKTRQGTSWSASRKGFLPVVLQGYIGRGVFGYVKSSSYDDPDTVAGPVDAQGAVQIRMWVQEAATGDVVWSNRISVQVGPESVLADNQYDAIFNTAVDKSVTTLVDHFVAYGL